MMSTGSLPVLHPSESVWDYLRSCEQQMFITTLGSGLDEVPLNLVNDYYLPTELQYSVFTNFQASF